MTKMGVFRLVTRVPSLTHNNKYRLVNLEDLRSEPECTQDSELKE